MYRLMSMYEQHLIRMVRNPFSRLPEKHTALKGLQPSIIFRWATNTLKQKYKRALIF